MTALLLDKPNGTTATEADDEEEEDEEYHDDAEGIDDNYIDSVPSSAIGSKRGVDELAEDASDEDDVDEAEVITKKARV